MNSNFNLPPGCLSKDIDGREECVDCFQVATHHINGQPFCTYPYEGEMSNKAWEEETNEKSTDDNTPPE